MKGWKQVFLFLMINLLISVGGTYAALSYWERSHHNLPPDLLEYVQESYINQATETPPVEGDKAATPQPTPTEVFFIYQVQSGETFESIAEKYNMSINELVYVNGFKTAQPLEEGDALRIPENPKGVVEIDSVIGPGDLETEKVLLKHIGSGEFSLAGWQLAKHNGESYTFPQAPELVLYKNGAVYLNTKSGADSVVDLYWGRQEPVWKSGDVVVLLDPDGKTLDSYTIP
jgi:LysM repeat protein